MVVVRGDLSLFSLATPTVTDETAEVHKVRSLPKVSVREPGFIQIYTLILDLQV